MEVLFAIKVIVISDQTNEWLDRLECYQFNKNRLEMNAS